MKYFFCFAVVALCALAFNSCGSSRLPNDYQAFLAHQQEIGRGEETPEWETVQPKRKKRELDECLVMANEESDAFRSYGVGVSYRENIALELPGLTYMMAPSAMVSSFFVFRSYALVPPEV